MNKMIAFCGLDCEKCDAYIATQNNDDVLRQKTADLWSKLNNIEIYPEQINCDGCRVNGRKTVFCECFCTIRRCGLQKGFDTCGDCAEMERCQKVAMIIGNNVVAFENLKSKK
ncbi:MAG: DUF3795 domain-containing protein [Bacteroidales bacterium]|nr:DUF3795 domain-containing protein [Bacteroidales bacterium]